MGLAHVTGAPIQYGGAQEARAALPVLAARLDRSGVVQPELGVSAAAGVDLLGSPYSACSRAQPPPRAHDSPVPRRVSRDDDLLLPYPLARTRPSRDCARVRAGSREHESWPPPPATPGASHRAAVRTFVSHFGGRAVAGHLTRVAAPLSTFSVLEPGGPGGCAQKRRSTVEDTAVPAGCLVAQNGGFFRMGTGECLGNVVSDGRLVSSSGGLQNAQFGIRRDGTLVTG